MAAAQLHSLRDKVFVRAESLGRESWYELCEPLMRLVFEIKESRGRPIRLIVDFLRRWYSRSERRTKHASSPPEARITRQYIEAALDLRDVKDWEPYGQQAPFIANLQKELTESLSAVSAPEVSVAAAEAWNAAWQVAGKQQSELEIPLRLLDAATQWRKKPDRRILLRLPIEERCVLEAILPSQ